MKQVKISLLTILLIAFVAVQLYSTEVEADCDAFPQSAGHPCWAKWQKRDERCGHDENLKYSFQTSKLFDLRCYCCKIPR